ncbi:MAG TPA: integrase, partial [Sphingomicrobium sp.]|nr:integrase [Sphingomicrobium sp.]
MGAYGKVRKRELKMTDLSKVKDREALKSRREPYWQRLQAGRFLGYRPSTREGAGTWIARAYDENSRKYRLKSLGDFGDRTPSERFAIAKREAEEFASTVESGGHMRDAAETVADACRNYAKVNLEAEGRFK